MAGRPTEYTQEIADSAWDYIEGGWIKADHAMPSVVGLCRVIGRAKSTIYDWAQDEEKQFSDILASIKELQELTLMNGGLRGEMNSNIVKLALGKHGYHDKADNTLSGPGGKPVETAFNFIPVGPKK